MEDILASIRRILSEDEGGLKPQSLNAQSLNAQSQNGDVLTLDASMMVEEPETMPAMTETHPTETHVDETHAAAEPVPAALPARTLVAPETAAAVTSSVGDLVRTLVAGRDQVQVHRGGPTIEDLVREEMRPLLKEWLDANLQPLVERLVRVEIERLVGRALS